MGFREVVRGLVSPTPFMESCELFSGIRLHRMSLILLVNILLSEEDCHALEKDP